VRGARRLPARPSLRTERRRRADGILRRLLSRLERRRPSRGRGHDLDSTPRAKPGQRLSQQPIECYRWLGTIGLKFTQSSPRLSLTKTEVAQGREDLGMNFQRLRLRVWLCSVTIRAPVRVSDLERARAASVE
jgi:hypothetical protein